MRLLHVTGTLYTLGALLATAALAGESDNRRDEHRQSILEQFDADGDGELSDDERRTAREAMRERRAGDRSRGNRDRRPRDRRRGSDLRGPAGPPRISPDEVFDRFDADGDEQLSRDEFRELSHFVRRMREELMAHGGPAGLERLGRGQHGPPMLGQRFGPPQRGEHIGRRGHGPPPRARARGRKNCDNCDKQDSDSAESDSASLNAEMEAETAT